MTHSPALARTIPDSALGAITRAPRSELSHIVPKNTAAPGLIESNPVLDSVAHSVKDHTSVAGKISDELLLVQETAVALVQLIGQVPVEESDQGLDARLEEIIYELDVVLQTLLVDGVVAASEGDDAGPAFVVISRRQSAEME